MSYYVFVYGTLRRDYAGGMARYLRENAEFITDAHTPGDMFYFGYPGVVEGDGQVVGDVFRVSSDEVLTRLDGYEGHPGLFERRQTTVTGTNGEQYTCWMYYWQGRTAQAPKIEAGDYLAHIGADDEEDIFDDEEYDENFN